MIRGVAVLALALSAYPSGALAASHCFISSTDLPAGAKQVPSGFKRDRISISDPDNSAMAVYDAGGPLNERLLTLESIGLIQTDSTTAKYVSVTWLKPDRPGGFWLFFTNNGNKIVEQKFIFYGQSQDNVTTVLKYGQYGLKIVSDAAVFIRSICFADKKSELPVGR